MSQTNAKILAKFRTLASTGVSFKALAEHLPALGFSVEQTKVWKPTGIDTRYGRKSDACKACVAAKASARSSYGDDHSTVSRTWYAKFDQATAAEARAAVEQAHASLSALVGLPAAVKLNKVCVAEVQDLQVEETRGDNGDVTRLHVEFKCKLVRGVKAYVITAPDGAVATFDAKDYMSTVLSWLGEHGLVEAASEALGLPTPAAEKAEREAKARDWTNTGTCPCCGANVKLRNGRLVLHGYQRPGWGSVVGECFGVGYEPYERSTAGCVDYRNAAQRQQDAAAKRLAQLQGEDFAQPLFVTETERLNGRRVERQVEVRPGDARWDKARQAAVRSAQSEIEACQAEIERMSALIDGWTAGQKMPEQIARERGWL